MSSLHSASQCFAVLLNSTYGLQRPAIEKQGTTVILKICGIRSFILTKINVSNVLLLWTLPKAPVAGPREEDATFLVCTLVLAVFIQQPPWFLLSGFLRVRMTKIYLTVGVSMCGHCQQANHPCAVLVIQSGCRVPFLEWRGRSGQSWHCVLRAQDCRVSDRGPAGADHPPQHADTHGRGRT